MIQEVYLIDNEDDIKNKLEVMFENESDYKFKKANTNEIDTVLRNIPALIIINEDNIEDDITKICNNIRNNEDNSITPIIVISSNRDKSHRIEILKACVEHYIIVPIDEEYLYYTIKNVIRLLYINRRVSPLTGLPGNVQIQAEMKKRLLNKENFSMIYFDLDNFKAYNDIYGFLNGDEIIKFTARTIIKNIHMSTNEEIFFSFSPSGQWTSLLLSINIYYKIKQLRR